MGAIGSCNQMFDRPSACVSRLLTLAALFANSTDQSAFVVRQRRDVVAWILWIELDRAVSFATRLWAGTLSSLAWISKQDHLGRPTLNIYRQNRSHLWRGVRRETPSETATVRYHYPRKPLSYLDLNRNFDKATSRGLSHTHTQHHVERPNSINPILLL